MHKAQASNFIRLLGVYTVVMLSLTLSGLRADAQGTPTTQDYFGTNLPNPNLQTQAQARRQAAQQRNFATQPVRAPAQAAPWNNFGNYNNAGNWAPTTILNPGAQQGNRNALGGGNTNTLSPAGTPSTGGGGGGGGGASRAFDAFSMLEMMDTSASAVEKNYMNAFPYEKLRMKTAKTKTMEQKEKPEQFGGILHGGERRPIVEPVTLPVGQVNGQEALPSSQPGFDTQGAADFHKAVIGASDLKNIQVSDTSYLVREAQGDLIMEDVNGSPEQHAKSAQVGQQAKMQNASDAAADSAENQFAGSFDTIMLSLINVANENAATPTSSSAPFKTLNECIWMVQQMYKNVYLYMAILLLLPGACMTQTKALVGYQLLGQAEDSESHAITPFTGIMRSMIAIFLIPATQLIVSWCIDIGNSMTYEVQKLIQPAIIMDWAKEQMFNPPPENMANEMIPPMDDSTGGADGKNSGVVRGKLTNGSEKKSEVETQTDATRTVQMVYNFMNYALGAALIVIIGFQIVMMCYLFLLGPIAAAFYAWPSGVGSLFNKVFVNWVDGVVNVSLWRFWWCVVILCMFTRIQWLQESGMYDPTNQWEMMMFTAFQVILVYVPFMPFEFRPGEMVDKIIEKAKEGQQSGQGGGGSGGGSGGSSGTTSSGGATPTMSGRGADPHKGTPGGKGLEGGKPTTAGGGKTGTPKGPSGYTPNPYGLRDA